MVRVMLFFLLAMLMLQGCEESLSNEAVEEMTVEEIAVMANSDAAVVKAFELTRKIDDARTEGMLTGATLPDGPGTSILATSTSSRELVSYFSNHDFKNAEYLAELYAERNTLIAGFQVKYKSLVNKLSAAQQEKLNALLPPTSGTITTEEAASTLVNHQNQ